MGESQAASRRGVGREMGGVGRPVEVSQMRRVLVKASAWVMPRRCVPEGL